MTRARRESDLPANKGRAGTDSVRLQAGKFVVVGLSNAVISYLVFMVFLGMLGRNATGAFLAQALGYGAGIFWSFHWNRKWTFAVDDASLRRFSRFIVSQGLLLAFSAVAMGVTVGYLDFPPTVAWLAVMTVVTIVNFILNRVWVFA